MGIDLDHVHRLCTIRLGEQQQRYTQSRRTIVSLLAGTAAPVTLPQLLALDPELTQSSTYRNLTMLEEAKVVRRLVLGSEHAHFELDEELMGHHHHLVCAGCGKIVDMHLDDDLEHTLEASLERIATAAGFSMTAHSIDIVGHCTDCQ